MADYWKSQPKKFCQYCKCWIADNKPSVEFHERGKNHKENVAAKIAEIKKKSLDKLKQEERASKEFAAMEEAALKAYEEDMRRMNAESGSQAQTAAPPPAQPAPQKKKEKTKKRAEAVSGGFRESKAWVEGRTEDGHTYYYNSTTGDSRWEKPEGFRGESPVCGRPGRSEGSSGNTWSTWTEAVSADGYTYYYNKETGASSWERPAGLPVRAEEPPVPGSEPSREAEGQGGPSPPQPEPLSGGEGSSNGAQTAKEPGGDGQDGEQSKGPKISFRLPALAVSQKRKPGAGPSEKEGDEDGSSGDDQKEDGDGVEGGEEEAKKPEATPEEQEKKKEEEEEEKKKKERPAKRPRTANPYGAWEQVQEEEDPYANIDLQLPWVEAGAAIAEPELPPEPKPKFRERHITSLGDQSTGPTSFRKSKTQNGKNKRLRQRTTSDD